MQPEVETREGIFGGMAGAKLYYQKHRTPSAAFRAVLIVVQEPRDSGRLIVELVQFLAPKGYVVYSFMRRDHKRAAGQPGYIEEWNQTQEDIAAFIHFVRALEPDAALFLVGDRLGARIVASYVLHQPEGLDGVIAFRADAISSEPGGTIQRLSRALAELWPAFGPPPPATSQMESLSGHQPDERASGGPAEDSEMRTDQELEDNPADLPVPFLAVDSTVAAPDAVSAVLEGVESWLERRID